MTMPAIRAHVFMYIWNVQINDCHEISTAAWNGHGWSYYLPGIVVQDNEDLREKIGKFSTTRNIVQWHDHSNIAGKFYTKLMAIVVEWIGGCNRKRLMSYLSVLKWLA